MWPITSNYPVAWCVSLSVMQLHCKNGWTNQVPVWGVDFLDPRHIVLVRGPDLLC